MERKQGGKPDDKAEKKPQKARSEAEDRSRADNPDYRGPGPQGGRGTPSKAEGDR